MSLRRLLAGSGAAVSVVLGAIGWMLSPSGSAATSATEVPRLHAAAPVVLEGADASTRRRALLRQATFHVSSTAPIWPALDSCVFVPVEPSGTTPKFDCAFATGEVMKVKYGGTPEPHAEVAATKLLHALGYGADNVTFSPRLRCYGCPRHPFVAMHITTALHAFRIPAPAPPADSYTDFEWVSVERNLELPAVETRTEKGWAWWELRRSEAGRDELDAFRLLAVFLAHWDNKAENQRLVCIDASCSETLALMQDVGATFGPNKVNLERWRAEPIWADRRRCRVSMANLPFNGATFPDATIAEGGRALLASELARLTDDDVRRIFTDARFPEFYPGTDNERDLAAWTSAFKHRVAQIASNRCPEP